MMIDEILTLPLSVQCSGFVGALLLGAALSLVFAVLKATRLILNSGTFAVAAEDMLYCIFSAAAAFAFLMKFSYGRLRWYVFAGIFLGWIIFKLVIGDHLSLLLYRIAIAVFAVIKTVISILFFPFKAIFGYIVGKISFLAKILDNFTKKVRSKCKFRLKKYMLALYNLLYTAFYSVGKRSGKGCEHRGKKKKAQKQLFR